MEKEDVKIYINILLCIRGWEPYYLEPDFKVIANKDFGIKLEQLEKTTNSCNESDRSYHNVINLFNDKIFKNVADFNALFFEYNNENIYNSIDNKEFYIKSIEKLISYATKNNIPIIRFKEKRDSTFLDPLEPKDKDEIKESYRGENKQKYGSKYYGVKEWEKGFIMFVDAPNECLSKNNISLSNQYINVLAHEIGHSMDEKFDGSKLKTLEEGEYKIKREIDAWEKAIEILAKLEIENTDINLQKTITVNNYKKYYCK